MVGKRSGVSQGSSSVLFGDGAPLPSQTKNNKKQKTLHSAKAVFQRGGTFRQNCPLSSTFLLLEQVGRFDRPHPQSTQAKASLPWNGTPLRALFISPLKFPGARERGQLQAGV